MLDRDSLISVLKNEVDSGSLLTPKHDPNGMIKYDRFRTVLTPAASSSLLDLIKSEEYEIKGYWSKSHRKYFYTIEPNDTGSFNPAGFGILSGSLEPTGSFDTLLIASGSEDGWHIYSQNSSKIQSDVSAGLTEYRGIL